MHKYLFPIFHSSHLLMLKIAAFICTFLVCLAPFKLATILAPKDSIPNPTSFSSSGSISPGRGYSRDRQQMSDIVCFNTKASPYSKTESIVRFDQGSSFIEMQTSVKIDVSTKFSIGIFSVSADVEYMKEIRDTDYSLSINYYQLVQSEITMEMGYGPAGALTLEGLKIYGPVESPNPRFGLICGDRFISSYKSGATLIFSIKLHFHSHTEKDTFTAKFGVNFGPWNIISASIQKTAQATSSSGEVRILAYQSGGNTAQLSKLMNSSCGDKYCAATCTMLKMTDCGTAINNLLKYAVSNFPNQINVQDPNTLSPFSVGFANLQDIKWVGLDVPPTFITADVKVMREKIGNITFRNQHYFDALTALMQAKLPWVKTSKLYNQISNCLIMSKQTIEALMNQNFGGIVCFNDPQNCPQNGNKLISQLKECSLDSLNYITSNIHYKLSTDICSAIFYRVGETSNWVATNIDSKCSSFSVKSFNVQPTSMAYVIEVIYRGDSSLHSYIGDNIHSQTEDSSFSGTRHHKWGSNDVVQKTTVTRIVSEYYFDLYS